jgi:hypothetical protein
MTRSTVEDRLANLEKRFADLRAQVPNLTPEKKDWRATVGMMPDDEISRGADRLGREWRMQVNEE